MKKALEDKISAIAGTPVELTIRGDHAFTFSVDVGQRGAAQKIAAFFAGEAVVEVVHDEEVGSFVYVDALPGRIVSVRA